MFCSSCGSSNDQTAKFCEKCGAAVSAAPPPRADPDPRIRGEAIPAPRGELATGKSPGIALVLSILIPGVGQFYNGDAKKGGVMLAAAILGVAITFGIVYLGVLIWSAIDAYQVAAGKMKKW